MSARRLLVAVTSLALAVPLGLVAVPAASAAEGDLDTAFSGDGVLPLEWAFGPVANTRDIATGPGGSVYLAGDSGANGCVTRVTAAGALDTTFDSTQPGSWCNTQSGSATVVGSNSDGDVAIGMRPVSGGRLVVRLGSTGALDRSVALAGDLGGSGGLLDVLPLSDGRTVLLETTNSAAPGRVVVIPAVGTAADPWMVPQPAGRAFLPEQVLPGPGGTLLLVGVSSDSGSDLRMTAARVTAAGAADTSFDGDGFALGAPVVADGGAAGVLPDGDLLLAGIDGATVDVVRLTAAGARRPSFGTAGLASWSAPADVDRMKSLVVRPDGRFYVVHGRSGSLTATTVVTERRRADGSADTTYSGDGVAVWASGASAPDTRSATAGALGPKGDLYVHADNTNGFEEIVRFDGTENAPPTGFTVSGPSSPWALSRSLTLRVTGTDVSGVTFEVREARGTAATGLRAYGAASSTTARTRTATMAAGETVCLSVRAADVWGNRTAAAPVRCAAAPLTAASMARRGFSLVDGRRTYASKVLTASGFGATATTAKVKARQLALVASTCSSCGAVAVSFAGRILTVVDLRGRSRTRVVFPVATFPQTRVGKVSVKAITSGRRVTIEGIGVLAGPAPFVTR